MSDGSTAAGGVVGGGVDGGPGMEMGFIHAFIASLSVIVVSELGDKTFFIAAIMAMRHPRCIVFTGAIGALALMTVLSGKDTIGCRMNGVRIDKFDLLMYFV